MLDIVFIEFKFCQSQRVKDKVTSSKPLVIKLIVDVKVVTNLNRA